MKKKALVVTHGGDPDGIISAAILHRNLLSKYEVEFVYVIYSTQKDVFNEISKRINLREYEVFVADLSVNEYLVIGENGEEPIVNRIARLSKKLIWVDHHIGTNKHKELLESLSVKVVDGYEANKCASRLIFESFLLSDEYLGWLSQISQNSDYPGSMSNNEIDLVGRDLYKVISLFLYKSDFKSLTAIVTSLFSGKDWFNNGDYSSEIRNLLNRFKNEQVLALQILKKSIEVVHVSGRKIMIGYGPGILPDKDTIADFMKADQEKCDCYVIPFGTPLNNALVLRGNKSDFTVVDFCSSMSGGGRKYGQGCEIGGFSFAFEVTSENFKKAKEIAIEGLKNFLS